MNYSSDYMIEWINFISILVFAFLSSYFYAKSVSQFQLEEKIGQLAYEKCTMYRYISLFFFILIFAGYIIYYFYPLPVPIPQKFPVNWWILATIAFIIAVPCIYIYYHGVKDAGEETMRPKENNELFGGIYNKIRHPQAAALLPFGWILGLFLNSPFLVILSFIWIPAFYLMCKAEEKDLILRYGDIYIEYKKRTGFFLPKLR